MDFSRKHRLPSGAIISAGQPFVVGTDMPLQIEPSEGPPAPEIKWMDVRGEWVPVLMETRCADETTLVVMEAGTEARFGDWIVRAVPRPAYRSVWEIYGLRRRPRRS